MNYEYMRRELTTNAAGILKAPKGWRIHTILNHGYSQNKTLYVNVLLERVNDDSAA